MVHFNHRVLLFALALTFPGTLPFAGGAPSQSSDLAARVNGEPITRGDLRDYARPGETDRQTLDRVILYRLAVQAGKKRGLDHDPELQKKVDKLIYERFLADAQRTEQTNLEPSSAEIAAAYDRSPMIRLRHLLLNARNSSERARAEVSARKIAQEIKAGRNFKDLVLKFSQDGSLNVAGDLDFRNRASLPGFIYEPGIRLRPAEIAGPIEAEGGLHWIQLVDKKTFADAPATYVEYLRNQIKNDRTESFLRQRLDQLKKSASIEISPEKDHS